MDVLQQKVSKLKPLLFRGLSTDIRGNLQLISDEILLYPIGKIIAIYNKSTHSQHYIKLCRSEKQINLIAVSPDRKYVAVAEKHGSPRFSVYDIQTRKRLKLLGNPIKNCTSEEFVALTFTHDSKHIVGVVGHPDWLILYYSWQRGRIESHAKAIYSNNKGTVNQICANPEDKAVVVIVGEGLYRQMSVTEKVWRQYGFQRAENIPLRSVCWLNVETVLAGSADGRLILVRSSELRAVYQAHKVLEIEFQAVNESQKTTVSLASNAVTEKERSGIYEVRSLTAFKRGFAFSCISGVVSVFEKISTSKYVRKNVMRVQSPGVGDLDDLTINQIRHISISPSERTMGVTTLRTELYIIKILVEQDLDKEPFLHFQSLDDGFHHGPIASVSTCVWKPLFITVGALDKTARIWDYNTRKTILIKDFPNEIYSASFHPSGLYCLMGFTDKLKLLLVLIDDLRAVRQVDIKCCTLVSFSYGGSLFAAVNGESIEVYSAVYFNRLYVLEDHHEPIRSILFTYDDYSLYVCDGSGYMFKWELAFQRRLDEYTSSGGYCDVACTKDGMACCTVSNDGTLKEAVQGEVSRVIKLEELSLNSVIMSNSNELLVIGSEAGTIYSVLYPLIHPPIYIEFYMHTAPVQKIIMGPRDASLISISTDGALCIWSVLNVNKDSANDLKNITDILVSVSDYNEKINVIKDLGARLHEIETEHAYILQQITAGHEAALKEFHKGYLNTIEDLKFRIKQVEREHLVEMNEQHTKMDQVIATHGEQMEKQNKFYTAKLIEEYEKYEILEQKNEDVTANCHQQIKDIKGENEECIKQIVTEKDLLIKKYLDEISKLQTEVTEVRQNREQLKSELSRHVEEQINRVTSEFTLVKQNLDQQNHQLMCENGIKMKQAIKYLEEIDSYKMKLQNLKAEMELMKKTELNLVQEVKVLKVELAERDWTINEKDKIIIKVTERNQELSKKKFVLSSRIEALENKLAPKGEEMANHRQTVENLTLEIAKLKANVENKDFKINTMRRRLLAYFTELKEQKCKTQTALYLLKVIKNEVFRAKQVMFDYCKLKRIILEIYSKYDNKSTIADLETCRLVEEEFISQKKYLESIIAKLTSRISKLKKQQSPIQKHLLNQNMFLLKEVMASRQEIYELKQLNASLSATNERETGHMMLLSDIEDRDFPPSQESGSQYLDQSNSSTY
uniref:Cilia- and flagella-associated protein 57 n=1 Tax=Rhodnius prolixus TaxID=13249 RepID=A0ABL0EFU1_RHOPR